MRVATTRSGTGEFITRTSNAASYDPNVGDDIVRRKDPTRLHVCAAATMTRQEIQERRVCCKRYGGNGDHERGASG